MQVAEQFVRVVVAMDAKRRAGELVARQSLVGVPIHTRTRVRARAHTHTSNMVCQFTPVLHLSKRYRSLFSSASNGGSLSTTRGHDSGNDQSRSHAASGTHQSGHGASGQMSPVANVMLSHTSSGAVEVWHAEIAALISLAPP